LVGFGWVVWQVFVNQWSHDQLVLSPETTRITSPLDELGYPDYVVALNERISAGVTSENNAAVLLLQAMGPDSIPLEIRSEFFELLGVSPVPVEGQYFESWMSYATRVLDAQEAEDPSGINNDFERQFEDQFDEAFVAPWTRDEFPDVGMWLDENDQPLKIVFEASLRSRFYSPLVRTRDADSLMDLQFPLLSPLQEAAQALGVRAMLRLGEGDLEGAWDDMLACRRLGRLVGQGSMVVDALVALAMDGIAFEGELQLVANRDLTAEQCLRWRRELAELTAMPKMVEKIDIGDRFVVLDAICKSAKYGPETLSQDDISRTTGKPSITTALVDWNIPLKLANQWMDRLVDAASIEEADKQSSARAQFLGDLQTMTSSIKEPPSMIQAFFSRRVRSEKVGQIMVDLMLPVLDSALTAESRHLTQQTLIQLALAVAAYRADRGEYPASLGELQPKYIDALPTDAFAGRPLVYRRTDDGYVLYSVGQNGLDEGGRNTMYDEDGDDWQVSVPAKVRPKIMAIEAEPDSPHSNQSAK
jgi:hypothetical protein